MYLFSYRRKWRLAFTFTPCYWEKLSSVQVQQSHGQALCKAHEWPEQFLSGAWPPSLATGCCLVCYLFTGLRYCNGRARRWAHTTGVTSECLRSHRSLLSTIAITVVFTIYMDLWWVQLLDLGFGVGGSIRGKPSNFQQGQGRSQSLGKSQTISEIKQLVEQWCHSE